MILGTELANVSNSPSNRTKDLLDKKEKYVARGIPTTLPIFVDEAKGAVVKDIDDNTYIDLYAGIGVLNAGHRPDAVVGAIKEQTDRYLHTSFPITHYAPYVELAKRLAHSVPGNHEKKCMFVNSGAEAVENAVKICRSFSKKTGIIAFESGFHGRTLLAMSLTSKVRPYKFGFGPYAPEIYKVPSAYCYRCIFRSNYPECGMHCLEHIKRFFVSEADPESLAAMVIEPVQGEGGIIVPPPEFLPGLKKICEENGILFIADEIQTGFARTGKMYAVEHFGVIPDLIVLAKSIGSGIPLSAVVGKAEIMDAPDPGYIGGTYGGNPVACAAGLATLELMEAQNMAARGPKIGETIVLKLRKLQERYPEIGDIRALGAMIGIEFVKDRRTKEPAKKESSEIMKECLKRGLLLMGAGTFSNVIRMLIPLAITDEQLEQAIAIFEESCNVVLKNS